MFPSLPRNADFPRLEEAILEFWRAQRIYDRSLEQRSCAPRFVFYEGPPTANGLPHPGHCLTRAIKDLFPRYRTMRGYRCERKGGWDTHGLPVEVEVCKELGIHSKEEIEAFGVEPFVQKCQQSVWRYMQQWARLTERLGFWIHLEEAYVTYHQSYVESVWWSLKNLFDRGLLYQGHKIVWWWAQGGTALSSGEVGQGYRQVADPSVFVRFPLVDRPDTSLLVWTTTPWTLPSNQFAAVHPELDYATVWDAAAGQRLIMAAALVETIAAKVKRDLAVESTQKGSQLIGQRYRPPFTDTYYSCQGEQTGRLRSGGREAIAWRVVGAPFVTTDAGTGVVHQAPAFGEVDYEVLVAEQQRFHENEGPSLICAVASDGRFTVEAPAYQGRWVKEADKDIARDLRQAGILYHQEQYLHDYPFCWRSSEDPLIQYPRMGWFVRTTQFKDRMLANNRLINWLPDHIRDGRFGNFLETNVDWALSRERFWGTPLPIWVCESTGRMEAIAHYDELLQRPDVQGTEVWAAAKRSQPDLPEDLKVHKPYIDAVHYASPFQPGARMRRVPEVIDCWYDSGAMPFAQWGYPHRGQQEFQAQFPADFISEALDQTRGWFYSLLAISTLLFSKPMAGAEAEGAPDNASDEAASQAYPHPYRNCVVLGLMLAESQVCVKCGTRSNEELEACPKCGGAMQRRVEKMSKQLRNYREPNEIFDRYGADALRWYLFANQAPWNSIIYSERAIKESIPEFLLRIWNVFSFFNIYANIDQFTPATELPGQVGQLGDLRAAHGYRPVRERGELDRWILSELHRTTAAVVQHLDAYDNYQASTQLKQFIEGLSNWYVRRSRDRFWSGQRNAADKIDAHWTLYECLLTTAKLIAPFVPFFAETMWRNLTAPFGARCVESVHLCDYPTADPDCIDAELSEQMQWLRDITSLGRSARMEARLKVRQPLARVEVVLASPLHRDWLEAHAELIMDELNVKQVSFSLDAHEYIEYQVRPNFKLLGPKLGKDLPQVKQLLSQADGGLLMQSLQREGGIRLTLAEGRDVVLSSEEIDVRLQAKPGWAAAQNPNCVVVLSTELTDSLIQEGYARDLIRLVQDQRKAIGCEYTDRIQVRVACEAAPLRAAIEQFRDVIAQETLATELSVESALTTVSDPTSADIDGHPLHLQVTKLG